MPTTNGMTTSRRIFSSTKDLANSLINGLIKGIEEGIVRLFRRLMA